MVVIVVIVLRRRSMDLVQRLILASSLDWRRQRELTSAMTGPGATVARSEASVAHVRCH